MTFPFGGATVDLDFQTPRYFSSGGTITATDELTISRASSGFAKNLDGTLTSFASNVLRITNLGLRIEDARTNLALQSQTFGTTWNLNSVSVTSNSLVAPDGTTTADVIVETATGPVEAFAVYQSGISFVAGTTYALSVFGKAQSHNYLYIDFFDNSNAQNFICAVFDLQNGVVGETKVGTTSGTISSASIEPYTNGWYRCTLTGSVGTLTTPLFMIGEAQNASGNSFNSNGTTNSVGVAGTSIWGLWGAQAEDASQGSAVLLNSSSYIATTTASATRAAESITTIASLQTTLAGASMSAYAEVILDDHSFDGAFSGNQYRIINSGGSHMILGTNGKSSNFAYNGFSLIADFPSIITFTKGGKVAYSQDGTSRSLVAGGGIITTDAHTEIAGTCALTGAGTYYGYLRRLAVWNTRISDTALKAITMPSLFAQACL